MFNIQYLLNHLLKNECRIRLKLKNKATFRSFIRFKVFFKAKTTFCSFPDSKSSAGIKMEVKQEVKTEIKSEESSPLPATPIRVHPATGLPTKEEEYDSSATVSIFHFLKQLNM